MEHVIQIIVNDRCVRLIPEAGYVLADARTRTVYSEAFVRPNETRFFRAAAV